MSAVVGWHSVDGERDGALQAGDSNPLDAANECEHGALPTDRRRICDCWPQQANKPLYVPEPAPDLIGVLGAAQESASYTVPRTPYNEEDRMATATNGTSEQAAEERARAMHAVYWPEDPDAGKTLDQVGEQFGISGTRVRQEFARFELPVRGRGSRPGKPSPNPETKTGLASNGEQDRRIKAIGDRARRPGHDPKVRTPEQIQFFADRVRADAKAEIERLDEEEARLRQSLEDELTDLRGERESIEAVIAVLDRE